MYPNVYEDYNALNTGLAGATPPGGGNADWSEPRKYPAITYHNLRFEWNVRGSPSLYRPAGRSALLCRCRQCTRPVSAARSNWHGRLVRSTDQQPDLRLSRSQLLRRLPRPVLTVLWEENHRRPGHPISMKRAIVIRQIERRKALESGRKFRRPGGALPAMVAATLRTPALTRLPPREQEVATIVYLNTSITANEVQEALPTEISNSAVRSMLNRLVEKGVLRRSRAGAKFFYGPAFLLPGIQDRALERVAEDFFGGSLFDAADRLLKLIADRLVVKSAPRVGGHHLERGSVSTR